MIVKAEIVHGKVFDMIDSDYSHHIAISFYYWCSCRCVCVCSAVFMSRVHTEKTMCLYAIKGIPRHYLRLVGLSAMREKRRYKKTLSLPTARPNESHNTKRSLIALKAYEKAAFAHQVNIITFGGTQL